MARNYRLQDPKLVAAQLSDSLGFADAFKVAQGRERWAKKPERKDFWGSVQAEVAQLKMRRAAVYCSACGGNHLFGDCLESWRKP